MTSTSGRDTRIVWYAACDLIARQGPFESQVEAWASMRLAATPGKRSRRIHAPGAYVWPETQG